jgi:hypothetical protein
LPLPLPPPEPPEPEPPDPEPPDPDPLPLEPEPEPLSDVSAVVTDVAGTVADGPDDFAGIVVGLVLDPPPLPDPPPLLPPVVVAGPLVVAGSAVVPAPPPPGPFEPDPPEPELGAPDVLGAGAEVPTVLTTVVDGTFAGALPDGAVLVPAGGGAVLSASVGAPSCAPLALTVTAIELAGGTVVGAAVVIVVVTPAAVVTGTVELVAALAGAEMSQTD